MPTPLNNEERYIIAYLKSDRVGMARWGWFAAQCFAACVFAYGFYTEDRAMIFTGFGTLLLLDFYAFARQPQTSRSIRSAIIKLEEQNALAQDQSPAP